MINIQDGRPKYTEKCEIPASYLKYVYDNQIDIETSKIEPNVIEQMLTDTSNDLLDEFKVGLFACLDDEKKLEMLMNNQIELDSDLYKTQMVQMIEDEEKRKTLLKDNNFEIGSFFRALEINNFNDDEFAKECIENSELSPLDKHYILMEREPSYIIGKINSGMFDELDDYAMNSLIISSKNIDFIEESLINRRYRLTPNEDLKKELVNIGYRLDDPKLEEEWNDKIDEIKDKLESKVEDKGMEEPLQVKEQGVGVIDNFENMELPQDDGKTYLRKLVETGASRFNIRLSEIKETYRNFAQKIRNFFDRNNDRQNETELYAFSKAGDGNDRD